MSDPKPLPRRRHFLSRYEEKHATRGSLEVTNDKDVVVATFPFQTWDDAMKAICAFHNDPHVLPHIRKLEAIARIEPPGEEPYEVVGRWYSRVPLEDGRLSNWA